MKTFNNLYEKIISLENLYLAWKKARKGNTLKDYVTEFEKNLDKNLMDLHLELKNHTYKPLPLVSFILRDPKTRVISKSNFRDRIIHHAICNIIEPIFENIFIYDSCANRIGKGNLFALKRLEKFWVKVTKNLTKDAYCLKADIKHYFHEVSHNILIEILQEKITDKNTILLIKQVLSNNNFKSKQGGGAIGMPIGNLTSQFFANVYLNELDYFVKHELKAKYYVRYVDDFVILHDSKEQLEKWKIDIDKFLRERLELELHKQKSKIVSLSRGVDFVGFRNFFHFRIPRKRNIRKMMAKVSLFEKEEIVYSNVMESFQGWQAYVKWSDSFNLRKDILRRIAKIRFRNSKLAKKESPGRQRRI